MNIYAQLIKSGLLRKRFRGSSRVIAILILTFACTNPFSTREPETPEKNNSTFINPTSPDVVFVNLQIAISEKNVESYIRSFVDSSRSQRRFIFVPDQGVAAARHSGAFLNWDLESERRYLAEVFQATPGDSLINLSFFQQNRSETATSAELTQNYTFIVRHSRRSPGDSGIIRGQAKFSLERNEDGDWAIYRWEDFKLDAQDQSWSDLKADF